MVLFILSEIINLKNIEKTNKQKISVLNEFHASLTKKQIAAHTCYLRSLYPYPCLFNILKSCDAFHKFKVNVIQKRRHLGSIKV